MLTTYGRKPAWLAVLKVLSVPTEGLNDLQEEFKFRQQFKISHSSTVVRTLRVLPHHVIDVIGT